MDTLEDYDRFLHHDIEQIEPAAAWAERELLRARLAQLIWQKHDGDAVMVVDGEPIREVVWIRKRIGKLDARMAGRRAA